MFLIIQKSPVVGHRQRGAVGHPDLFTTLCAVEHTVEIHRGGGEVQVGEVDLSVQLHLVLLWESLVVDLQELGETNVKKQNVL